MRSFAQNTHVISGYISLQQFWEEKSRITYGGKISSVTKKLIISINILGSWLDIYDFSVLDPLLAVRVVVTSDILPLVVTCVELQEKLWE